MNCGRAPTTLAIFTELRSGRTAYNDIVPNERRCCSGEKRWAASRVRRSRRNVTAAVQRWCATPRSHRFSNSVFGLKPLCAAVPSDRFVRVAVIGLGYVGLPLAAAVAASGARVVGIDIDPEKGKAGNAGENPPRGREPGVAGIGKETGSTGPRPARPGAPAG